MTVGRRAVVSIGFKYKETSSDFQAPRPRTHPVNRRIIYIAVALVVPGIALSVTYVVFSHLRRSQSSSIEPTAVAQDAGVNLRNGKYPGLHPTFKEATVEPESPCKEPVEDGRVGFFAICIADDVVDYKGFRFERLYLNHDRVSTAVVKRGNHILARHSEGRDRFDHDSTFFGLFPLLGGTRKQLIIVQFTGGLHCCFDYWIYDLYPRFRLIFDGTKYEVGDGFDPIAFQDLDGDGSLEFTQKIITFDYTLDCYTCTPQPTMVFKYDDRSQKYLPANRRFMSYVLKDTRKDIQTLKALMREPEVTRDLEAIEYHSFDLLLTHVYAGRERQGWRLYYRFAGWDGDAKWRHKIRTKLRADSLYQFLYSR
jgi:hypothetical protein